MSESTQSQDSVVPVDPANIGFRLLKLLGPTAAKWIKAKIIGKILLIVGPEESGKTCLVQYLMTGGPLWPEGQTYNTGIEKRTPSFEITYGRSNSAKMTVKTAWDTRGQAPPEYSADLVLRVRPHALTILLDLEKAEASLKWLREYCRSLQFLLNKGRREAEDVKSRLMYIQILLNKIDKIEGSLDIGEFEKRVISEVREQLGSQLGNAALRVKVFQTVLVNPPDKEKLIIDAIHHLCWYVLDV